LKHKIIYGMYKMLKNLKQIKRFARTNALSISNEDQKIDRLQKLEREVLENRQNIDVINQLIKKEKADIESRFKYCTNQFDIIRQNHQRLEEENKALKTELQDPKNTKLIDYVLVVACLGFVIQGLYFLLKKFKQN
jgi:hypothetical protein